MRAVGICFVELSYFGIFIAVWICGPFRGWFRNAKRSARSCISDGLQGCGCFDGHAAGVVRIVASRLWNGNGRVGSGRDWNGIADGRDCWSFRRGDCGRRW